MQRDKRILLAIVILLFFMPGIFLMAHGIDLQIRYLPSFLETLPIQSILLEYQPSFIIMHTMYTIFVSSLVFIVAIILVRLGFSLLREMGKRNEQLMNSNSYSQEETMGSGHDRGGRNERKSPGGKGIQPIKKSKRKEKLKKRRERKKRGPQYERD